ncbi:hypothetical protein C8J27_101411 [Rhodobacter aestuarii]|uniref:Cobalt chelatase n=1 Tax=Rhodobacter aestuarii TaxID=453582 RepID=A0A1N7J120_9RHOB|nr:hypothetical protein [Rhodobacter aestuarii]PTV97299.1 hypothetical protein C8J27_101411 [Rhodobacter aestuarii]SIS43082.1 hypothetical protein SAMN05421580_101231 [Rhodobacter aestuarii]
MDYSKSGGVKPGQNAPRHAEHNAKGSAKNPFGKGADKADLLARMKAAAEARKTTEDDIG